MKGGGFGKIRRDLFDFGLSTYELAVYVALCIRADYKSGRSWPRVEVLAGDTGISVRTVRQAIRRLEELGLIAVEQRRVGAGKRYEVLFSDGRKGRFTTENECRQTTVEVEADDQKQCRQTTVQQNEERKEQEYKEPSSMSTGDQNDGAFSFAEEDEEDDPTERFSALLDTCFFAEGESYGDEEIKALAKRAVRDLWDTASLSEDGKTYERDEIRQLLLDGTEVEYLHEGVRDFLLLKEVRFPLSCLKKCLFHAIVTGQLRTRRDFLMHREKEKRDTVF